MSKRPSDKLQFSPDTLTDRETGESFKYLSFSNKDSSAGAPPENNDDDLLSTLSAQRENRRARQVFEWEIVRRRAEATALTQHYSVG